VVERVQARNSNTIGRPSVELDPLPCTTRLRFHDCIPLSKLFLPIRSSRLSLLVTSRTVQGGLLKEDPGQARGHPVQMARDQTRSVARKTSEKGFTCSSTANSPLVRLLTNVTNRNSGKDSSYYSKFLDRKSVDAITFLVARFSYE
jgi:hypothetical protein